MNCDDIEPGMWVKTHSVGSTRGMLIAPKNLDVRREGVLGQVRGWVGGHGGDVWWVDHHDPEGLVPEVGAYGFWELEPAKPPDEASEGAGILE
jgi:hypothetical protein